MSATAPCGHKSCWKCETCSLASGRPVWHCSVCLFEEPPAKTNVYTADPDKMKGAEDGFGGSDFP